MWDGILQDIMKRKICVITGTRAEYGLLYWLMKEIQEDTEPDLQVIVAGMHLSPESGRRMIRNVLNVMVNTVRQKTEFLN